MAITTAYQKEAFPLAGRLSVLGTGYAWNLSKLDMRNLVAGGAILTIPKALSAVGNAYRVCSAVVAEFLESIKKGSIFATLECVGQSAILHFGHSFGFLRCLISFCAMSTMARMSASAFIPTSSILVSASRELPRQDSNLSSPCSFNLRRVISPCMAVTINPALLSPSCFTDSIASKTSWGTRTVAICDLAFFAPAAISESSLFWCMSVYTEKNYTKALMCITYGYKVKFTLSTGKAQEAHKIATPRSGGTLPRRLTTNDRFSIEAAMQNHITPLTGRNSLTPNKFTWRFLAVSRSDRNAKPCRMSVEAHTEREARQVLAPHFILSLAARLPIPEVSHV